MVTVSDHLEIKILLPYPYLGYFKFLNQNRAGHPLHYRGSTGSEPVSLDSTSHCPVECHKNLDMYFETWPTQYVITVKVQENPGLVRLNLVAFKFFPIKT